MATGKQKTAMTIRIELEENILRRFKALEFDKDTIQMQELRVIEMKQLRDEVEKQQIINAAEHNNRSDNFVNIDGEDYYTSTFEQ